MKRQLTDDELWELREQITLCSLFTKDFENDFGIDAHKVQDYFDAFADTIHEAMEEDGLDDSEYFNNLSEYDTKEFLLYFDRWLVSDELKLYIEEGDEEDERGYRDEDD